MQVSQSGLRLEGFDSPHLLFRLTWFRHSLEEAQSLDRSKSHLTGQKLQSATWNIRRLQRNKCTLGTELGVMGRYHQEVRFLRSPLVTTCDALSTPYRSHSEVGTCYHWSQVVTFTIFPFSARTEGVDYCHILIDEPINEPKETTPSIYEQKYIFTEVDVTPELKADEYTKCQTCIERGIVDADVGTVLRKCVYCRDGVCQFHSVHTDEWDLRNQNIPLKTWMCIECSCK